MKLAFICEDESWFWVLDETGRQWQAWYEYTDQPAVRCEKMDRWSIGDVTDIIQNMAIQIANEEPINA